MRFVVHVLSQTEKEEHILLGCLVSINETQMNKERIHKESHQRKQALFQTTTTITTTTTTGMTTQNVWCQVQSLELLYEAHLRDGGIEDRMV